MEPGGTDATALQIPTAERSLRPLVDAGGTAPRTVAATMRRVFERFEADGLLDQAAATALAHELDELEAASIRELPVREVLLEHELSPRAFMALMVNTLVRVLPTYAEVPLNHAMHGVHGDLQNYGLIALNVADEAGEGDPLRTHPTLFNGSAAVLARIFRVPPLSVRVGQAALALKRAEGTWGDEREALDLVYRILRQDEQGNRLSSVEMAEALERAIQYAELIAPEAVQCYAWRMNRFADVVASQLRGDADAHDGYVALTAMLAVREAAASDPEGIFCCLTKMVLRYGGYLEGDVAGVRDALDWSDVHVDEGLGEQAGYEGHSVEEDHAIQALGAVLDQIHDGHDLTVAVEAMNAINRQRQLLWEGTVRMIDAQEDPALAPCPVDAGIYEAVRRERMQA